MPDEIVTTPAPKRKRVCLKDLRELECKWRAQQTTIGILHNKCHEWRSKCERLGESSQAALETMKQDHELKAHLILKLVLICLGRFEFDEAACDREEIVRLTSQLWTHYDAGGNDDAERRCWWIPVVDACSECAEWKRRCEELDTKARMHEKQHAGLKE